MLLGKVSGAGSNTCDFFRAQTLELLGFPTRRRERADTGPMYVLASFSCPSATAESRELQAGSQVCSSSYPPINS